MWKICSNRSLHKSFHLNIFGLNLEQYSLCFVSDPKDVQYKHGMMEQKLDL